MKTRSLVVGYFHPIFLTNSDTPQSPQPLTVSRSPFGRRLVRHLPQQLLIRTASTADSSAPELTSTTISHKVSPPPHQEVADWGHHPHRPFRPGT